MNSMRRFVAALLAVALALAMPALAASKAKFTRDDVGGYVKFRGSLYGYEKPAAGSRSRVIVRKGSVARITDVRGKKWVKLRLTRGGIDKQLWFGADKLKALGGDGEIRVVFSAGGSNLSEEEGRQFDDALEGRTVRTTGKVNLRKSPSLRGKSRGTVKKGRKLKLTGWVGLDTLGVVFFQVKGGNWVSAEYTDRKNYQYID